MIRCKECDQIFELEIDPELYGCEEFLALNVCEDCEDEEDLE